MIGVKLCQLYQDFHQDWIRHFANGPFPALHCIDEIIQSGLVNKEETVVNLISAVRERLVCVDDNVNEFLQQIRRELVVKQFLLRVLEICCDSDTDLSENLTTVCCQLSVISHWNTLGVVSSIQSTCESNLSYSESLKSFPSVAKGTIPDRSNTLPRLCYSSSNKNKQNEKDVEDRKDRPSENLNDHSEYDEMFKRNKNNQKPNVDSSSRILGAKDNFLAVTSKHIAPSVIPRTNERVSASPHLNRNFQLLKLTDGFDLVLGDTSVEDCNKRAGNNTDLHNNKGDGSRVRADYHKKTSESTDIKPRKTDDSTFQVASQGTHENITTIQIRKPGLISNQEDIKRIDYTVGSEVSVARSEAGLAGSEVTSTKQNFVQESSIIVCTESKVTVESFNLNVENSSQSCNFFPERQGHSQSFQNSLRKFSTKGSVVPPPVAKKPVRTGSSNKLPSSPVETPTTAFPINDSVGESAGNIGNNSQTLLEINTTHTRVINNSYSAEGICGLDGNLPRKAVEYSEVVNTEVIQPWKVDADKEVLAVNSQVIKTGDCQQVEIKEEGTIIFASDNSVKERTLNPGGVGSSDEVETVIVTDTDMSFYRIPKSPKTSRNSSNRNSVGDLVEGIGYNVINMHRKFDEYDTDKKADESTKASRNDLSLPDIPCRLSIHTQHDPGAVSGVANDNVDNTTNDFHIYVSSASKESHDGEFDYDKNVNASSDTKEEWHIYENVSRSDKSETGELSPETKKRLSSTSSYEAMTINRAITRSTQDLLSVSDDDELDDAPTSPIAASPCLEQQDLSSGSKDSGLCDDISTSEISQSDSDISYGHARDHRAVPQKEHRVRDEQTDHTGFSLDRDANNQVLSERDLDPVQSRHKREEDIVENLSVDTLSVDTQSVPSDGDDETGTIMDSSCDETDSARDGMLNMRQLLVKGVLDSEKGYLGILSLLIDYKRSLEASSMSSQPVISKEDIHNIFSNIEEIIEIQAEFVSSLEAKVAHWTHGERIGEIFKIMISKLITFGNYLNNYQQAVSTIHKCCQESEQFEQLAKHITVNTTMKEVTSLEDALFKPVQRVQRNTLVLHDLIKYTPEDHPDYSSLQKALRLSQHIIENFATLIPQKATTQENRRLVKSSFLVEDVGGARKLRYIFLFSDVLVCTKRETRRNNKISFEIKWFAPLSHSIIDTKFSYSDDNKMSSKDDISELKSKLKGLKRELKTEIRKSDDKDRHRTLVSLGGGGARNVEKLKKKVNQAEAQLLLASPKLPFKVLIEGGRSYTLLMSTDYEREEWRETVAALFRKCSRTDLPATPMSSIYIQELINNVKETPQVNKIGSVLLKKDEDVMTGILNVTIHKVNGLTEVCDAYCNIEMDSFGHFFYKARTTICERTQDPAWNEDFDLELEGSETLRILCFKKEPGGRGDTLLGRGALELSKQWLKGSFQEKTLSMNEISLVMSMRHIPADKTMQRTPSRTSSAVFGVSLSSCAKREAKTVPMIVTACVQEVEKRGFEEVGIYRVSGVSSELQHIKRLIDKNVRSGTMVLQDADIHSVTGVLKLYLRELPEPLFTEANYHSFVDTLRLSDDEAKTQCMLALLHGLPDTNYYTIVYLLEHLIKVAKHVSINKMSIQNLSTIFGPTLLAPATKQTSSNPLEMMCKGAEEVMHQSSVINFLLGLAFSGKSLRKSAQ